MESRRARRRSPGRRRAGLARLPRRQRGEQPRPSAYAAGGRSSVSIRNRSAGGGAIRVASVGEWTQSCPVRPGRPLLPWLCQSRCWSHVSATAHPWAAGTCQDSPSLRERLDPSPRVSRAVSLSSGVCRLVGSPSHVRAGPSGGSAQEGLGSPWCALVAGSRLACCVAWSAAENQARARTRSTSGAATRTGSANCCSSAFGARSVSSATGLAVPARAVLRVALSREHDRAPRPSPPARAAGRPLRPDLASTRRANAPRVTQGDAEAILHAFPSGGSAVRVHGGGVPKVRRGTFYPTRLPESHPPHRTVFGFTPVPAASL